MSAAIFDMDGLLLDSEIICLDTFKAACEQVGYTANIAVYLQGIGCNQARSKQILIDGHGADFPYQEIKDIWYKLYVAKAYDMPVPLMQGVSLLLDKLTRQNIPLAVATSTAYELALKKLENANILHYFDYVVGGDQVQHSKPSPEIYLKAATQLKHAVGQCIAFEDSVNGVRAALDAGIEVVQVPDLIAPSPEVISWGHQIVASLEVAEIHFLSNGVV